MRRLLRLWSSMDSQRKANCLAGGILLAAIGILRLEAAPIPAGSQRLPRLASKAHSFKLELKAAETPAVAAADPAASTEGSTPAAPLSPEEKARQTLQRKLTLLDAGIKFLRQMPDYTAQFTKQELVDDELTDEQTIFMKVRHEPFSVYLKWITGETGREALYVEGLNDGEMLVRSGGWKSRLGTLSIDPNGSLAMREARYPVTKAGLLELALMIQEYHQKDLELTNYSRCEQLEDQEFDGRKCACYFIEYKDPSVSPTYRKSITLIDKEWSVPLYIKNYTWPTQDLAEATGDALDEATLIEFYSFADVKFRQQLANRDFDRENEEYRLR
jgi:hypothetical protein